MMHNRDQKKLHILLPENKDEKYHDGIQELKNDALNTTKPKEVKLE